MYVERGGVKRTHRHERGKLGKSGKKGWDAGGRWGEEYLLTNTGLKNSTMLSNIPCASLKHKGCGWRDRSAVRSTHCTCWGPEFSSQHPCGWEWLIITYTLHEYGCAVCRDQRLTLWWPPSLSPLYSESCWLVSSGDPTGSAPSGARASDAWLLWRYWVFELTSSCLHSIHFTNWALPSTNTFKNLLAKPNSYQNHSLFFFCFILFSLDKFICIQTGLRLAI